MSLRKARRWGYMDDDMSRAASVRILQYAFPPYSENPEMIASYVEQLSDIPEDELREVIVRGLAIWYSLPSAAEILAFWNRNENML
jgi:hypothetical protein